MNRILIPYSDKSQFYFNLYNPVFCGSVLRIAITKYEEIQKQSMPFPLVFLILPLVLNKELRTSMNPRKNLHYWVVENPHKIMDFDKRISELTGITKLSLMFLLQAKIIGFDKKGDLKVLDHRNPDRFSKKEDLVKEYYQKARTVGTWFADINDDATIFSFLGVKP